MRMLAILATLGFAWGMSPLGADAQEKLARLTAPDAVPSIIEMRNVAVAHGTGDTSAQLGLSEVERRGIEDAVRGQIRALASRDAEGAFNYLSPVIQDYFLDATAFFDTLQRELPPVMKARVFALAGLERQALDAIQHVVFAGPDGREWLAEFTVERQSDGSWRIKSCQVERARGQST